MANKPVVLKLTNVTKKFGTRVAVNNVSFEIHEGEIFGFLGPNGAGKTTTMRMICGLCRPTEGEIYVCGYSVKKEFENAMKNVGALIENPLMYGYMTGMDNLKYYGSLHKNITKDEIMHYAQIVGLENRLNDKVKNYSLGMRQRLGIAQALLHEPKLLVLDEPLSGLDPNGVKEMRDFLKKLAHEYNIALLISSHMLSEMEHLCDTIGIINNGKLLDVKNIKDINADISGSKRVKIKVNYPNFAGKLIQTQYNLKCEIAGNSVLVNADEEKVAEITKMLIANNISIFGVETIAKPLEEVFMDIIKIKSNGKIISSIL